MGYCIIYKYSSAVLIDLCSSAGVLCPVIPLWDGVEPTTTERESGTTTGYNCSADKMFQDGDVFKETTCDDTGSWTPRVAPCTGKT